MRIKIQIGLLMSIKIFELNNQGEQYITKKQIIIVKL